MDSVLAEIYQTVMPAAPYVIGAYLFIWLVLGIFVLVSLRRTSHTMKEIDALKSALDDLHSQQK